ncbi:shikimate dehydrogenase [Pseudobacteroides cellulosolvens]|uniref:Shikimate dehydrogenase (NADP(+)) n=1 Tax=Pseudobacteroides cellulosolvens ATCC 35603 = DSM 2933 TaxID=398512 RepID=A0A0L6JLN2_9FIRM|nr:shikimate dehydrogenase [Pseudobacteroides cellulosolvens]KNY26716.1 Shikimate dehydrogenase [Pseudobacteroides cellulosolvens ATCC 35603 = DSM 2933]
MELSINARTKIIGIIGDPIEHSKSPILHNYISASKNINAVYVPFRVHTDNLLDAVRGLRGLNVVGFNVTVPHKNKVMEYLDCISEEARLIGAVNTVKNIDGKLWGYNTDGDGFLRSFKEETGHSFKGERVVIIGAGGAARAVAVKVALEGASEVVILNRSVDKAKELSDYINNNISCCSSFAGMEHSDVKNAVMNCRIVINTTSVGMYPEIDKSPIESYSLLNDKHIVYDIIYNPVKTELLKAAGEKGSIAVNGMGMLFYQGIYAYEKWMDIEFLENEIEQFYMRFKETVMAI